MKGHTWYPENNGRKDAPYKPPIHNKGRDLERRTYLKIQHSISVPGLQKPIIGSVNEKGEIRKNVPLVIKAVSYHEEKRRITNYYFVGSDHVWYAPYEYFKHQVRSCLKRKKKDPLKYQENSFIYILSEEIRKNPDRLSGWKGTIESITLPVEVASIDDIL